MQLFLIFSRQQTSLRIIFLSFVLILEFFSGEGLQLSGQGLQSFTEYLDSETGFCKGQVKAIREFSNDLTYALDRYFEEELKVTFNYKTGSHLIEETGKPKTDKQTFFNLKREETDHLRHSGKSKEPVLVKKPHTTKDNQTDRHAGQSLVGPLNLSKLQIEQCLDELEAMIRNIEQLAEVRHQFKLTAVRRLSQKAVSQQDANTSTEFKDRLQSFVYTTHEIIEHLLAQVEFSFFRFFILAKYLMDQEQFATNQLIAMTQNTFKRGEPTKSEEKDTKEEKKIEKTKKAHDEKPFQPFHWVFKHKKYDIEINRVLRNQDMRLFYKLVFQ